MVQTIFWKCPVCDHTLSCGMEEDSYDVRFDTSREVGCYVTFHHCHGWRKARIESIEEVA